jgi:acetate kinase
MGLETPNDRVVLVLNAGSSSVKFAAYSAVNDAECLMQGEIEGVGTRPRFHAHDGYGTEITGPQAFKDNSSVHDLMQILLDWIERHLAGRKIVAAGHRVVLGGLEHTAPVLINGAVLNRLRALIPLMPVHQPRNLEPVEALAKLKPDLPQVACFDTAFHRTMPEVAQLYGVPRKLTEEGARRYGFHGLSYEYIASVLPTYDEAGAKGRTVMAHLGSGASLCAIVGGRSMATTMGFSALSGLIMGTRPGELDPGILLWLMQAKNMKQKAIEAVDLFNYRICRELGSLAAAAGGLDTLVFTAGIGEHAAPVRTAVCRQSAWLGIELDEAANERGAERISLPSSSVSVWVIPTDEERMIARHTSAVFAGRPEGAPS